MQKIKLIILITILFSTFIYAKAINPNNFYKTIKSHKVVLVKFWAPWCGPCNILKPKFEKAKHIAGKKVLFATYNVDLRGEPLKRYNIRSIPTMILFVNGKEIDRSQSILNANDISSWVLGYVP